jgi:hypothetical protein
MSEAKAADFESILNTQMEAIEKPKPIPQGKYRAHITGFTYVKSDKKNTPGAEFKFKVLQPIETEDDALANSFDYSDRELKTTYWLTKDSLFRLKEFLVEQLGLHDSGRPLGDVINEAPNNEIGIMVRHGTSQRTGDVFANIDSTFKL